MSKKWHRHSPEQIVAKLRDADVVLNLGKDLAVVLQSLELSEATYHSWRNQFGGMNSEEAKRLGTTRGLRLLRGENVGYGSPDWSDTRTLETLSHEPFREYQLRDGDVVIGMDRTFTKSGTKITLLRQEDCPCLLVQRVGRFISRGCDARFLWFVLSSSSVQSRLRLEQKGMDIPHLSRQEILQPVAAIPSVSTA